MSDDCPYKVDLIDVMILTILVGSSERVRNGMAQAIREIVSIRAGDAAQELAANLASMTVGEAKEALRHMKQRLPQELQGPADPRRLIVHELMGGSRYREPTPGCACPHCTLVKELAADGIRVDDATGETVDTKSFN